MALSYINNKEIKFGTSKPLNGVYTPGSPTREYEPLDSLGIYLNSGIPLSYGAENGRYMSMSDEFAATSQGNSYSFNQLFAAQMILGFKLHDRFIACDTEHKIIGTEPLLQKAYLAEITEKTLDYFKIKIYEDRTRTFCIRMSASEVPTSYVDLTNSFDESGLNLTQTDRQSFLSYYRFYPLTARDFSSRAEETLGVDYYLLPSAEGLKELSGDILSKFNAFISSEGRTLTSLGNTAFAYAGDINYALNYKGETPEAAVSAAKKAEVILGQVEEMHADINQLLPKMEENLELTKQYRDEAMSTEIGTVREDLNQLKGDINGLEEITTSAYELKAVRRETGYIKTDGTIDKSFTEHEMPVFNVENLSYCYFTFTCRLTPNVGWAAYWILGDNGTILSFEDITINPQVYDNKKIYLPSSAKEVIIAISDAIVTTKENSALKETENIYDLISVSNEISASSTELGYLKADGTIDTVLNPSYEHAVFDIEEGIEKISISFTSTLSLGAGWATLWLVDENGNMIYSEEPETYPQVYDNHIVNIVEGTKKLYVQYPTSIVKTYDKNIGKRVGEINKSVDEIRKKEFVTQWNNKTWYAYGTSITSIAQGKYVPYVAQLSKMNVVNKGIPGGGITNLGGYSTGQVKDAIMNTTDGKLDADLITLEVGANEGGEIGTMFDNTDGTFAGCLTQCIQYLLENTRAQIVVMPSVSTTTLPVESQTYYERLEMVKKVCDVNRVYFIDGNCCLGSARIANNTEYTSDNIHQTDLGGYVLAEHIWSKLKHIPLFLTELPIN